MSNWGKKDTRKEMLKLVIVKTKNTGWGIGYKGGGSDMRIFNCWEATSRQHWVYRSEKWRGGGLAMLLLKKRDYVTLIKRLHQDFQYISRYFCISTSSFYRSWSHLKFTSYHQIHLLMKSWIRTYDITDTSEIVSISSWTSFVHALF